MSGCEINNSEVLIVSLVQIIAFLGLWVLLKLDRGANWSFVNLSRYGKVLERLQYLHEIRLSATQPPSTR